MTPEERIEIIEHDLAFLARIIKNVANQADLPQAARQTEKIREYYEAQIDGGNS